MPEEDFYFCNQLCLDECNLEIARVEDEDPEFGPGMTGWRMTPPSFTSAPTPR